MIQPGYTPSIQSVGRNEPLCKDYEDGNVRRITYRRWPIPHIQSPKRLAEAGFFYKGEKDQVTCYQCGFTLNNWEVTDIPEVEHKKWSPQCPLVLAQSGEQPAVASTRTRHELPVKGGIRRKEPPKGASQDQEEPELAAMRSKQGEIPEGARAVEHMEEIPSEALEHPPPKKHEVF